MRKFLLPLLMVFAVPLFADSNNRSQSYFTYDDGGTIVRQGDDGKEVEARVNFPVYAGDEITTSRRGRAEIRLSDGNVLALDRGTTVRFGGIRDSYDGDGNNQTIIELKAGHVMLERDSDDRDPVRLDTPSASFAATERAIYSVDTERERGLVRVYDGSIEVRTPSRTTRVRAGEEGRLDDQGLYDLVSVQRGGADDFEKWFLERSGIYRRGSSRYLDRSLAYSEPELDRYGSWVYVSDYGSWCWRPVIMSAGWRPYYHGYWHHGRGGALVWVSYEPWGWVPYHYGRWSYAPTVGWVWLPGGGYSPAWVYWMYGPSYIGWAPAGWYDCYRPYYGWAYRPYARVGFDFGFGFYGRVRVHDIDLRPWTFVSPGNIVSGRVDRAALTTDAIRQRLSREGGGLATVSGAPARFTRSELRDPATAIGNVVRRGIGGGTGREGSGSAADMTSFFRRDPALSVGVRDQIVRSRNAEVPPSFTTPRGVGSGIPTPGTGGTLEGRVPRDGGGSRHAEAPATGTIPRSVGGGTVGGVAGDWRNRDNNNGSLRRGGDATTPATTAPPSASTTTPRDNNAQRNNWRDRFERPANT
ncbi:MAG TPA: FecR family protein, partial [Thermoanaerobaculia bacterium]